MDGQNQLILLKLYITKSLCYKNSKFHLEMKNQAKNDILLIKYFLLFKYTKKINFNNFLNCNYF